ncbi:S1 family peptidase [Kineobactrum sediminis]|nr:serine protease [Kineobactrum sediminis]
MKVRHLLFSALLLLVSPPLLAASLADIIERVSPSVVGVGTSYPPRQPIGAERPNQLLGTGFAVGDGQYIVTNYHVLPELLDLENKQVLAVFSGRGDDAVVRPATLVAQDVLHDLALLRISSGPLPTLELSDATNVREGDPVAFTGFPIGAVLGLYPVTHRGMVSSITPVARTADAARDLSAAQMLRMRNPFNVLQLDAIAYPGNSGSPVYHPDTGRVLGVVNSVFVKESREAVLERPSGITYVIPVVWVRELLARASP